MKHPRLAIPVATALVVLVGACSPNVYAPPARPKPLQSAHTAGARHTIVQTSVGTMGEIFGPNINHATVNVRHGIGNQVDVEGDLTTATVHGDDDAAPVGLTLGRIGLKYDPEHNGVFALAAGAGGGTSPYGAFVSGDLGFILSAENRYLVPFFSLQVSLSQPISPRPIYVGDGGGDNVAYLSKTGAGQTSPYPPPGYAIARTTLGIGWNIGLKVPLGGWHSAKPARLAWVMSLGGTTLSDSDSSDSYASLATGLDFNF